MGKKFKTDKSVNETSADNKALEKKGWFDSIPGFFGKLWDLIWNDPYAGVVPVEATFNPWEEDAFGENNQVMVRTGREVHLQGTNPINITSEAASKIFAYTRAVKAEIGGLLLVDDKNGVATITDAMLYKQKAHCSGVEIDSKGLANQLHQIALKEPEKLEKIKGWWHSHYNFGLHWSGVDDACFSNFSRVCPVVYGIVVNQAGDAKVRVDMKTEIGLISVRKMDFDLGKITERPECIVEVKQKVNKPSFFSFWPINKLFRKKEVVFPNFVDCMGRKK